VQPRRIAALALSALLSTNLSTSLGALELRFNGASLPAAKVSQALAGASRLRLGDGSFAKGLSLGEIYPFISEIWGASALTRSGVRTLRTEGLAERMYAAYLVESGPGGYDLVIGTERLRGLERLDLLGEALSETGLEVWLSWEGVPEIKAELARIASIKGLQLKALEVPNTQTKLVATARGGGREPDLALIQSDYIPSLAGGKLLQSLDYVDRGELAAKGFEAFSMGGRNWAIPFYYDAELLFYNRKLARAPGPDYCLADLEAWAAALKGSVRAPLAWNLYSAYWLLPFMLGFGKDRLIEADGGVRVDDEPTRKALEALLGLVREGLLVPAERDAMVSWFATGQAAYILSGSYSIPEFSRLGLDFAVAPYPLAAKGGRPIAPLLDFKGFAISRRTRSPVLARRVIQALTGQEFQARFAKALGKLPANEAAWADSAEGNPYYEALSLSAARGFVVPPAEAYGVFKNTMWSVLRLAVSGQMGVPEALAAAQRVIDGNMERIRKSLEVIK
jgi:ABC-type glycerol-3-phosphate transport system substrate-binding protein